MEGPSDLAERLAAVREQINLLHTLNHRFGTNHVNLSAVVRHGKQHGLIDKAEHDRLMKINQHANEAKHHDLGSTPGARSRDFEDAFDSADLGIVAVLEASHPRDLAVREVYLLGLARDPDKEQMGPGIKKEVNQRLYKLKKRGCVVTEMDGRWRFKSKIPESSLQKSSSVMPPQGSVLPAGFGHAESLTAGMRDLQVSGSHAGVGVARTAVTSAPSLPTDVRITRDVVVRAMSGTAEPLPVDEVALLCLGVADPKQAKKDLSKLLIALRDEGVVNCESGRWISHA